MIKWILSLLFYYGIFYVVSAIFAICPCQSSVENWLSEKKLRVSDQFEEIAKENPKIDKMRDSVVDQMDTIDQYIDDAAEAMGPDLDTSKATYIDKVVDDHVKNPGDYSATDPSKSKWNQRDDEER